MLYTATPLEGAYLIDLDKRGDDRGFFARVFCVDEFGHHGLGDAILPDQQFAQRPKGHAARNALSACPESRDEGRAFACVGHCST